MHWARPFTDKGALGKPRNIFQRCSISSRQTPTPTRLPRKRHVSAMLAMRRSQRLSRPTPSPPQTSPSRRTRQLASCTTICDERTVRRAELLRMLASIRRMTRPDSPTTLDRRTFIHLGASAAGGLLLSLHLVPRLARGAGSPSSSDPAPAIGLFVRIEKDGTTFIGARSPEIGQGVKTSLPMIIAEEMDADWSKVRVEQLPFGIVRAADGTFTWKYGEQGAGGSTNIPDAWADLRHAGARVRQVLLAAAAKLWNVPPGDLRTEPGIVKHKDGRSISYGELAPLAATLPLPTEQPPLKDPKQWRILG